MIELEFVICGENFLCFVYKYRRVIINLNVISCFDGISLAYIALDNLGYKIKDYWSFEIDPKCIEISKHHCNNIKYCGNIENKIIGIRNVDLIIGGFPCTDLARCNQKKEGLKGQQSKLFYKMVDLHLKHQPKYFLYENVASMTNANREIITNILGVEPIMIDSNLLTAQNRKRLYWTNIKGITPPVDLGLTMRDVVGPIYPEFKLTNKAIARMKAIAKRASQKGYGWGNSCIVGLDDKFPTLDANYHKGADGKRGIIKRGANLYYASVLEAEKLQGIPPNYTYVNKMCNTARYRMVGNSFTLPVVEHILSFADF